jgi:hypothetical protein
MSTATITAIVIAATGFVGAITALVATIHHITGPKHTGGK